MHYIILHIIHKRGRLEMRYKVISQLITSDAALEQFNEIVDKAIKEHNLECLGPALLTLTPQGTRITQTLVK